MDDYWPSDFGSNNSNPPRAILREQADLLSKKTRSLVEGVVTTSPHGEGFAHNLLAVVPLLDNYTYRLLVVVHPLQFYPLELQADVLRKTFRCATEQEFKEKLREVLGSDATKSVINAILAQLDDASGALATAQPK